MGLSQYQQLSRQQAAPVHAPTVVRSHQLRTEARALAPDARRARIARLRRSVGFAARAIEATDRVPGFRSSYVAMLTLTYRDGRDWAPEDLSWLIRTLRKWWARRRIGRPLRYVWVAEVQRRGAIHYHVALWLPPGVVIPKPDAAGWWTKGSTKVEAARAVVPYLMKYLSKGGNAPSLPDGARCHGCGGLEHSLRRAKRWLGLPGFVRARSDIGDDWRRARGGGWADPEGFVVPSEWRRAWLGDRWGLVRVEDYGRPFVADGPFSWISRGA